MVALTLTLTLTLTPYPNPHSDPTPSQCDVAYYNVMGWLTEIETGEP